MTEHRMTFHDAARGAALFTVCALAACGGNGEAHTAPDTAKSTPASAIASTSLTPDQLEHLKIAPVSVSNESSTVPSAR